MFYIQLVQNVGLLVALVAVHGQIIRYWKRNTFSSQAVSGFLFGCVALIGMMAPVHLVSGIIFDGRSIVLSVAGLFGGPVTAGMAVIMTGAYRLWLGGPGAIMGVSVIIESAGLGVAFYYLRPLYPGLTRNLYLFSFGLLVHVGMLLLALLLPWDAMLKTMEHIATPVMLIYPAATLLICRLFLDQESRISAEQDLRASEQRYRAVFDHAAIGMDTIAPDGRIVQVNPALRSMLGYTEDELKQLTFDEITYPDDRQISKQKLESLIIGEMDSYRLEKRYVRKDGKIVWGELTTSPIEDANRNLTGMVAVITDITERKRLEMALRESEERYRTVADFTYDWEYWVDAEGNFLYVSPSCERITGYSAKEFIEDPDLINRIIHPDDRDGMMDHYHSVRKVATYDVDAKDFRIIRSDGETRWLGHVCQPVYGPDGQLLGRRGSNRDINKRKQMEEAVKQSEDKYRQLVETTTDWVWAIDAEARHTFSNSAIFELLGYQIDDVVGSNSFPLMHPGDQQPVREMLKNCIEQSVGWDKTEIRWMHKDGSIRWLESSATPILDTEGQVVGFSGIDRDITDSKAAKAALERERNHAQMYLDVAAVMLVALNAEGNITMINRRGLEILGHMEHEIIGKNWFDVCLPAELRGEVKSVFEKLMAAEIASMEYYENPVLTKDGRNRLIAFHNTLIRDESGRMVGILSSGEDVTDRKEAEAAVQRSEEFLQQVVENIPNMIFVKEAENLRFVRFNRAGEDLLGYSREALLGKNDYDFFTPAQADFFTAKDRAVLTDGKLLDIPEEEIETKLKGKRILHTKKIPILNADGTAQFLLGISEDITERKQFEESQKLQSTAIEQSAEAVIITDARGIIQYVNPAQAILSGYSRDELIGQIPNVLNSDFHSGNFYEQIWDTIGVGKVWSGRFINRKKDGKEYHQDATISPIYDKSGNLTNFVVVQHDVTQQVELQEQLFQSQKMEAIGTLAGGFAHDFRNMLQVVMGSLELIEFNKDLPDHLRTDLDRIRKAATSGAELVKGMLVFSRKTSVHLEPLNLNKLVEQVESLLARTIPKMIKIDVVKAHDLSSIKGDSTQIEQILMNLAINAADAMPDGGRLTIQTLNTVLDEEFCRSHPNTRPGAYVLLSVTDTGTGMNEKTVRRIFEPFFTTKEKGKGTGLGLAVVYGIVEQHSARIICESKPSVGTTFRIYFPAIEEVHEEDYSEKTEPPGGLGETILMVDDEPSVLEIDSSLLNRANYKVIAASNAKDALELYEKHRDEIRLVLLDLIMPEIGGKQCLEALRNMDPNVKVLVITGYTHRGMTQELKDAGARDFILKPFDTPQLLEKIRKIIDEE